MTISLMLTLTLMVLLYLASSVGVWRAQESSVQDFHATPLPCFKQGWVGFAILAVLAHAALMLQHMFAQQGINLGFFNAASLVTWLIALFLVLAAHQRSVASLALVMFPLAALSAAVAALAPSERVLSFTQPAGLSLHIFTSLLSYSVLSLCALQAIVLSIQEYYLRRRKPGRILHRLPPLQSMENLLFQMLMVGVILLTLSLLSGFMFLENIFAQHLVHKTVLSMVAWGLFTGLLFGRWRYGWRGRTVVRWTLLGIFILMLGYFGSKFVLELILQKH